MLDISPVKPARLTVEIVKLLFGEKKITDGLKCPQLLQMSVSKATKQKKETQQVECFGLWGPDGRSTGCLKTFYYTGFLL